MGVEKTVIERVEVDEGGDGERGACVVAHVRPARGARVPLWGVSAPLRAL